QLVILGTGWGGFALLKNIDKRKYDVVVVSPRNHFLFTPLLPSTTVGTLEFRSIIDPIRNHGFRDEKHFHLAEAEDIEFKRKIISCRSALQPSLTYELKYNKLAICVGAVPNTFGVPGVYEHAYFLKEIADARAIRHRILRNFELSTESVIKDEDRKRLLHTVIVGGGPTGVEFGAELYDFIIQDVAKIFPSLQNMVHVTLVESREILPSFDDRLRAHAEKKIGKRERMKLLRGTVAEVNHDGIKLTDGTNIQCGLTVWSAGLAPRELTTRLDLPKTKQGQVIVDNYLHTIKQDVEGVYALGDCSYLQSTPLPCTAQVAEREGKYLAKVLSSSQSAPKPFFFKSLGMLAYVGEQDSLTDLPYVKWQGFKSWILWHLAYTTRLGSWRLRMQVPIDWFKTFIYGRDISRF
ncbi:uncharacterized protein TRIADDRAFT_2088, partial [Trichoplax adhaerens]